MTAPSGGTAAGDGGPVERYLDEMFDRLAGRGAAGRRMLAEAESHLLDAVEDGRARGLDAEAAERVAVERFGAVDAVVRDVRGALRRLLAGAWIVSGVGLVWWGGSGVLTWLLGWPWAWLLIATDRFGAQPGMCGRPWTPSSPAVDCLAHHRGALNVTIEGGDRAAYPWLAAAGLVLLAAWLLLRRVTALGTTDWTPGPIALGLGLAVPFGLGALVLTAYGIAGLSWQAQAWTLSYLVAAGISVAALRMVSFRRSRSGAGLAGR